MQHFKFDNIEDLQRNRKLECDGVEVGFPGDIVLLVRAASDANPLWKAQSERISAQIRRFATARASNEEVRAYLARKFAELLVRDWPKGPKSDGEPVPFSVDACTAFLLQADDVYTGIDNFVWENKNFRTQRVDIIVDHVKN